MSNLGIEHLAETKLLYNIQTIETAVRKRIIFTQIVVCNFDLVGS